MGVLQFDVVASRLKEEYKVECAYEAINVLVGALDRVQRREEAREFKDKAYENLAVDGGGHLTYLAPTRVNLSLMEERWPEVKFRRRASIIEATDRPALIERVLARMREAYTDTRMRCLPNAHRPNTVTRQIASQSVHRLRARAVAARRNRGLAGFKFRRQPRGRPMCWTSIAPSCGW